MRGLKPGPRCRKTDSDGSSGPWVVGWADLISFEVYPVLEDAEFAEVLTAHIKQ